MKGFFKLEEYSLEDITSLIEQGIEESISLDFKAAGSLDKSDGKKKEIGKDVSSFANSAGGMIIYGLKEENHKASEIDYIDGDIYSKEWLEHIISGKISPRIEGIKIYPLRANGNISQSLYIVKIPQSTRVHMNIDKKYYRRFNFESVAMEEYEVHNLYLRTSISEMKLEEIEVRTLERERKAGIVQKYDINLRFPVSNISQAVEHHYKIEIRVPKSYLKNLQGQERIFTNKDLVNEESGYLVYRSSNSSPIFPGEKDYIFNLRFPVYKNDTSMLDMPLTAKLYYSNGIEEKEFVLNEVHNKLKW